MDYEQYKKFEKIKQIEELIDDVQAGIYDDVLRSRFKHDDDFGNRSEMYGILSRMCEQLR